jgi:hypothetical protein
MVPDTERNMGERLEEKSAKESHERRFLRAKLEQIVKSQQFCHPRKTEEKFKTLHPIPIFKQNIT